MPSFKRQSNPNEVIQSLKKRINTTLHFNPPNHNNINPAQRQNQEQPQNQDQENNQTRTKQLPSKGPSNWIPPPSDYPIINQFFDELQNIQFLPFGDGQTQNDNLHFLIPFRRLKNNHA
uniref:Uncharacterized protein n=1 Tax=Clytia hemisphaerica TaxID=252671 RepID=A0A7M5US71_9CNID|eukprot:TCONS_00015093-protein